MQSGRGAARTEPSPFRQSGLGYGEKRVFLQDLRVGLGDLEKKIGFRIDASLGLDVGPIGFRLRMRDTQRQL